MAFVLTALPQEVLDFLRERHLASLSTLRRDGSPHVVAVGFTYDHDRRLARVITSGASQKARNAALGGRGAVNQVDGPRWLTLEGTVRVASDADAVATAVAAYAGRYRQPGERADRVAIEISVDRIMGRV
jgi:F420H(2)-dependent biliverdin reductase